MNLRSKYQMYFMKDLRKNQTKKKRAQSGIIFHKGLLIFWTSSIIIQSDDEEYSSTDSSYQPQPTEPRIGNIVGIDADTAWLCDRHALPVVEKRLTKLDEDVRTLQLRRLWRYLLQLAERRFEVLIPEADVLVRRSIQDRGITAGHTPCFEIGNDRLHLLYRQFHRVGIRRAFDVAATVDVVDDAIVNAKPSPKQYREKQHYSDNFLHCLLLSVGNVLYLVVMTRFQSNIAYIAIGVKINKKSASLPLLIKNFLMNSVIKKFSSPKMRNRQFVFAPKIEYKLVAERSEANQNSLTFLTWCAGEDSNLHVLADTCTSSMPGYRYSTRALRRAADFLADFFLGKISQKIHF